MDIETYTQTNTEVTMGGAAFFGKGEDGADGKSAYEVAVDNGYSGTVTEWLKSLEGKDGRDGVDGKNGKDGKDAVLPSWIGDTKPSYAATEIADGDSNVGAEITQLKEDLDRKAGKTDIPESLPNPNALTFTGAVSGSYDGSEPLTVEIPQGGGGGGEKTWSHARFDIETEEQEASSIVINNDKELSEIVVLGKMLCDSYDGFCVRIGNKRTNATISPNEKNCFTSIYIFKLPCDVWLGRGGVTQWDNVNSWFANNLLGQERIINASGNITIGSTWINKQMKIGSYFDVWWR